MKKTYLAIMFLAMLAACTQPDARVERLQARVDSLQQQLTKTYHPGFGEFMSGIQVHHAKLWFAGNAQNWKLADFEMGEIREAIEGIQQYDTDRPEVKSIPMILPALDSMDAAIKAKDGQRFQSSYALLTNMCNNCHRATSHEFNVIKMPDVVPFSNQVFKAQ